MEKIIQKQLKNKKNKRKFLFKKKKERRCTKSNRIKIVYWPITTKMAASNQFQTKDYLITHRYKRTLRAHLMSG